MSNLERPVGNSPLAGLTAFYQADACHARTADTRELEAMLDILDPDIVAHQPESLPYGGVWRGHRGFADRLTLFVECCRGLESTDDAACHVCGEDTVVSSVTWNACMLDQRSSSATRSMMTSYPRPILPAPAAAGSPMRRR